WRSHVCLTPECSAPVHVRSGPKADIAESTSKLLGVSRPVLVQVSVIPLEIVRHGSASPVSCSGRGGKRGWRRLLAGTRRPQCVCAGTGVGRRWFAGWLALVDAC